MQSNSILGRQVRWVPSYTECVEYVTFQVTTAVLASVEESLVESRLGKRELSPSIVEHHIEGVRDTGQSRFTPTHVLLPYAALCSIPKGGIGCGIDWLPLSMRLPIRFLSFSSCAVSAYFIPLDE